MWITHKYRDLQMSLVMQKSQKVVVLGWISVPVRNCWLNSLVRKWFALSCSLYFIIQGSQAGTVTGILLASYLGLLS